MTDYEIQGPTRVCAATGRELKPGDPYHAVLTRQEGRFARTDYAAEEWPGTPQDAVADWTGRVPASDKPPRPVVNAELLLDCFDRLKDAADENGRNFRYVAALLLMRKKRFKFEDVARDDAGQDILILKDTRSGSVHEIVDPRLNEEQIVAVQNEVFRVLGWE
jgi:hypothetical protein